MNAETEPKPQRGATIVEHKMAGGETFVQVGPRIKAPPARTLWQRIRDFFLWW